MHVSSKSNAVGITNEEDKLADTFRQHYSSSAPLRSCQKRPAQTLVLCHSWEFGACGRLLGAVQSVFGASLIVFDVCTNHWSHSPIAISAGILMILIGLLTLIATRRLDRGSLYLCVLVCACTIIVCTCLLVQNVMSLNVHCHHILPSTDHVFSLCGHTQTSVHAVLICYALVQGVLASVTAAICVRSLQHNIREDDTRCTKFIYSFGQHNTSISRHRDEMEM